MAVREFRFTVTPDSIAGSTVSKGVVQGEQNATKLIFEISDMLKNKLMALVAEGDNKSFYYRFDCYDGAGGMYSTAPVEFDPSNETEFSHLIAKRQTEFGGTIQVYFVITLVNGKNTEDTADDTTELELYSYSVKLMLKALPNGTETKGEDYESITTLAISAKESAEMAKSFVITTTEINSNGELIITYAGGTVRNIGKVKGEKGEDGAKGDAGNSGVHVGTDEPTDENINVWVDPDGIANEIPSGGVGTDGFSPTVSVTEIQGGHTIAVTDVNGTKFFNVIDGKNGANGKDGKDGAQGEKGDTGATGPQGPKGADGYSPIKGVDYWTTEDKKRIISEMANSLKLSRNNNILSLMYDDTVVSSCELRETLGSIVDGNKIELDGVDSGSYTLRYENDSGAITDYEDICELEVE